jgi:hypothetical protein
LIAKQRSSAKIHICFSSNGSSDISQLFLPTDAPIRLLSEADEEEVGEDQSLKLFGSGRTRRAMLRGASSLASLASDLPQALLGPKQYPAGSRGARRAECRKAVRELTPQQRLLLSFKVAELYVVDILGRSLSYSKYTGPPTFI